MNDPHILTVRQTKVAFGVRNEIPDKKNADAKVIQDYYYRSGVAIKTVREEARMGEPLILTGVDIHKWGHIAILTLVSNFAGAGPGHTAIVIYKNVYSFEDPLGEKHSWLKMPIKEYLKKNIHRPVIAQELSPFQVSAQDMLSYIQGSMRSGEYYVRAGVCSSQVASAVEAGLNQGGTFNPKGVDTPGKVYALAKWRGLVLREYYYWPGKDSIHMADRRRLQDRMDHDYGDVPSATSIGSGDHGVLGGIFDNDQGMLTW